MQNPRRVVYTTTSAERLRETAASYTHTRANERKIYRGKTLSRDSASHCSLRRARRARNIIYGRPRALARMYVYICIRGRA